MKIYLKPLNNNDPTVNDLHLQITHEIERKFNVTSQKMKMKLTSNSYILKVYPLMKFEYESTKSSRIYMYKQKYSK